MAESRPYVILIRYSQDGPVAQLGARFHGMEEVVSSNLTRSTKILYHIQLAVVHSALFACQSHGNR
jgi:hypothetical protein